MSYGNIFPYGVLTYGQESQSSGDVVEAFHFSQGVTVVRIPKQKLYSYGDAVAYGDSQDYVVSPKMANTLQAYGDSGFGGMSAYGGTKHVQTKQLSRTFHFTQDISATVVPKNNIPTYGTGTYGETLPYGSGQARKLFAQIEQNILFGQDLSFVHSVESSVVFSSEITHFAATRSDLTFNQLVARVLSNKNTFSFSQRLSVQPNYRSTLSFTQELTSVVAKPASNNIFFIDGSEVNRSRLAEEQTDAFRLLQYITAEIQSPTVLPSYTGLLLLAYQSQYEYLKATRLTTKSFEYSLW